MPAVGMLALLLLALGVLGLRWVEETAVVAAELRGLVVGQGLATSAELLAALGAGQASEIDNILRRALAAEPHLAYLALQGAGRFHLALRQDQEGARLAAQREVLAALHEGLRGPGIRRPDGIRLLIVPQLLPPRRRGGDAEGLSPFGTLYVAVSLDREEGKARLGLRALMALGMMGLVTCAVVLLHLLATLSRRLEQLWHDVQRLEQGDLRVRGGTRGPDEVGEIGRALDAAVRHLGRIVDQVRASAHLLERAARDAGEAAGVAGRGLATQSADTDEALQAIRTMVVTLGTALKQAESIREEARLASGIVQRLTSLGQESSTQVEEAERALGVAIESIDQLGAATGEVTRLAGLLGETASGTASAMQEVKQTIGRIREAATTAATLASDASVDAERGSMILAESLGGIDHIREASSAISAVTDDLQRRVSEIGDVLHLITELTQRTNLLALNASILAAQAGAEGRGFAVVADEIKDLARRTANSAGSIDSLIQSLADSAHAARRAAVACGEAVEAGAFRVRDAARTMGDVLTRLRGWAQTARSLTNLVDDQARSTLQVFRSIQEVQARAGEMATRTAEQSRRAEHAHRQGMRLQEALAVLASSAQEQRDGTGQVALMLQRLSQIVDEVCAADRLRITEAERVRNLLEILRRVLGSHRDALASLERINVDMRTQAERLLNHLERLQT
ncbi:MAG: methyl-accepting chemotaxis protein [Myxococcales bacterium]|nr:methyl-accepting chemotaxis protein [Myxococcota bacterium]MDW8283367.1 methyl-accepting chemotaxis protein [Myxococcales bacterium]